MAERTPNQIVGDILGQLAKDGDIENGRHCVVIRPAARKALAAPLEDANARIRELERENVRLREIEAAARAAGQITRDGKFARLGMKVWHPKHGVIGGIVEICGDSTVAAFRVGFWDGFGERPEGWNDYLVCDCYSTPEAAQAAKEGKP